MVRQQIMGNIFRFGVMFKFEMVEKLKLQHRGNLDIQQFGIQQRLVMFWLLKEIVPKLQKS